MQKKILFVSHTHPMCGSFGAEQRTNIIYNVLTQLGYRVDIAYIGDSSVNSQKISNGNFFDFSNSKGKTSLFPKIKRLCLLNMFPKNSQLSKNISKLIEANHYDHIVCRYLPYAAKCGLLKYSDRLLLDIDDMPVQALQIDFSKKKGIKNVYFNLLRKAYQRDTNKWIKKCKKCYVPNQSQAQEYGIGYLPNISSIWNAKNESEYNNLLFIGKLDWKPNYDGITHFLEKCWSEIHVRMPSTKLFIAGKGLDEVEARRLEKQYEGIRILGFVQDLIEFYKLGSIVICPIYTGAGTNIKIVEALSMSKALVVSKESTKGYENFLKNNENCLIAENDKHFISSVIKALDNPYISSKLSLSGFEAVKEKFSMEYIRSIISKDLLL